MEDIEARVRDLEEHLRTLELKNKELEKDLNMLQTGIGRVIWMIGGGLIAAITAWVVGGGLAK